MSWATLKAVMKAALVLGTPTMLRTPVDNSSM
jgi:hypothetical protein